MPQGIHTLLALEQARNRAGRMRLAGNINSVTKYNRDGAWSVGGGFCLQQKEPDDVLCVDSAARS